MKNKQFVRSHLNVHILLSRFNVESNDYVPSFYKKQEVAWKLEKPNNPRKKKTYVFRGLRVKEPLMNQQKYLKGFTRVLIFMPTFYSKMIWIKNIFSCNLSFINPFFFFFFEKNSGKLAVLIC